MILDQKSCFVFCLFFTRFFLRKNYIKASRCLLALFYRGFFTEQSIGHQFLDIQKCQHLARRPPEPPVFFSGGVPPTEPPVCFSRGGVPPPRPPWFVFCDVPPPRHPCFFLWRCRRLTDPPAFLSARPAAGNTDIVFRSEETV